MSAPLRLRRPEVIRQVGARTDSEENLKFYLDRLIKMIPAESVSLYLVGSGVIPGGKIVVLGVWIVVCIISVVAVRVFGTADRKAGTPPDWIHVVISVSAFVVWVYTLGGGFFAAMGLYVPWVGSLLVLLWTFFPPLFYRGPAT